MKIGITSQLIFIFALIQLILLFSYVVQMAIRFNSCFREIPHFSVSLHMTQIHMNEKKIQFMGRWLIGFHGHFNTDILNHHPEPEFVYQLN